MNDVQSLQERLATLDVMKSHLMDARWEISEGLLSTRAYEMDRSEPAEEKLTKKEHMCDRLTVALARLDRVIDGINDEVDRVVHKAKDKKLENVSKVRQRHIQKNQGMGM